MTSAAPSRSMHGAYRAAAMMVRPGRHAKETRMQISAKRLETLREHIRAESEQDMETLIEGMTPDCFNDVAGSPKPFVGAEQTAERYRKHWEGFPDFSVRVRRVLCSDENTVVT